MDHHRIAKVNQAMIDQYRSTEEDFIGLSFGEFFAHDPAYGRSIMEELLNKGELHIDTDERRRDGSQMWVLGDYKCIYDSQGKITGLFGVQIDITDRKKTEEELKNKQLLLRTLIDNIPDAVYTKDINLRKTLSNLTDVRNMGAESESEILGKDDYDLYPGEIAERFHADDKRVIQSGTPLIDREEFFFDRMGEKRWLLTSKIPLRDKDDRIIGLIGIGKDITDRKQAELIINQQNKELKKLNADKDRFISILGHDLRSPFSNFLGFTELLSKNVRKYDLDKTEKLVESMNKSATSTFNLLDDLLSWARAQQGNFSFEPQHLGVANICNEVIKTLSPGASQKHIAVQCFADETIQVLADKNMLRTILRNLVSNAIKFTREGGEIKIEAEEHPDFTIIKVSDNGIGMSSVDLPKIFDISEKITTSGTSGESGSGLGLLICKEFVDKHGGRIWAESIKGEGSVFCFTIPARSASVSHDEDPG